MNEERAAAELACVERHAWWWLAEWPRNWFDRDAIERSRENDTPCRTAQLLLWNRTR